MIFETLHASAKRGELLLLDGGMCHWHLRRDGQITIREILTTRKHAGIGVAMLDVLKAVPGATSLYAKCPTELRANCWYAAQGFVCEGIETTRTGRHVNCWRLSLSTAPAAPPA